MIKNSEILTILIQALMITIVAVTFVGCWDELIYDIKKSRKLLMKKGERKMLREYSCPTCGFSAWAMDRLLKVTCHKCGTVVETKPVPAFEGSFVCDEKNKKTGRLITEK